MTHARQKIRDAVAVILSRNPVAWKSVLKVRNAPTTQQYWPYLMVYTPSDDPLSETVNAPSQQEFNCTLIIDGRLRLPGTGDMAAVEEKFDAVGSEIQERLTFQSLLLQIPGIKSLSPPRTDTDILSDDEDINYGRITLQYTVTYATLEGFPGTLL